MITSAQTNSDVSNTSDELGLFFSSKENGIIFLKECIRKNALFLVSKPENGHKYYLSIFQDLNIAQYVHDVEAIRIFAACSLCS